MREPMVVKLMGDNGNQVEVYQAGKFTYTVERDGSLLVHNNAGRMPQVVNMYRYLTLDQAIDAAWRMASLQMGA